MQFTQIDGTTAILAPTGDFDLTATMYAERDAKEAIGEHHCTDLTVDFSKVTFLSSAGIRTLRNLYKLIGADHFQLVHITEPAVFRALKTAKLDQKFRILD